MTAALERGWAVSSTPRPQFTHRKDPVPIVQEAGWAPGLVWRAENLVATGIRSRTVQPVAQSLYWLSYRAHNTKLKADQILQHEVLKNSFHINLFQSVAQQYIYIYKMINIKTQSWYIQCTAVAQWLRCCATNRKVAGSIPAGVIGIFYWHNPSDRTMALGSTQPLTEMSTRSIS